MTLFTTPFEHQASLSKKLTGGKGYGLAVMAQAGIPVAPGFVVTTDTYLRYMQESGLSERIAALLADVDRTSIDALDAASVEIGNWFAETPLPEAVYSAIAKDYAALSEAVRIDDVPVAVRSSATAEDSAAASFAGEYETFVGIRGVEGVALNVRLCWASAFTARALTYAWKNDIDPLAVSMAVVVQKMVRARAAGVLFTISPLTGDRSRIVIEASYGLGLGVVGGDVTPDRYVVAKVEGQILERVVGDKHVEYLTDEVAHEVDAERRARLCLEDSEIIALAKLGKKLERMHEGPQDIEFAIDGDLPASDNIVLLQCRPVTVLSTTSRSPVAPNKVLSQYTASILSAAR